MPRTSLRSVLARLASVAVIALAATGCLAKGKSEFGTPCVVDDYEPNETQATAADLGELQDDPDSGLSVVGTLNSPSDVDWYRVHIKDTGLGGDPNVTVSVPSGFLVTTWFACDTGTTRNTSCLNGDHDLSTIDGLDGCSSRRPDSTVDEEGNPVEPTTDDVAASTTDCSGTSDDNGTLYVRVEAARSASSPSYCSYELTVSVD